MRFITPFPDFSKGARLLLLIGLMILGAIVSVGIAYLVFIIFQGSGSLNAPDLMANIQFVRVMQIFNQIGIFIIPPLLYAILTEYRPLPSLGFSRIKYYHLFISLMIIIVMSPLVGQLMEWNEAMSFPEGLKNVEEWMRDKENQAGEMVEWMLTYTDPYSFSINIFMIVFLPALGEELLFRAVLIRYLRSIFKNIHVAVWVSAIIFSAFHFQFFGFLPRMFLGLVFGYLFVWSGSIWLPILAHFINNGTVVVISWLNAKNIITQSAEEFGSVESPLLLFTSIILTSLFAFWFYQSRKVDTLNG